MFFQSPLLDKTAGEKISFKAVRKALNDVGMLDLSHPDLRAHLAGRPRETPRSVHDAAFRAYDASPGRDPGVALAWSWLLRGPDAEKHADTLERMSARQVRALLERGSRIHGSTTTRPRPYLGEFRDGFSRKSRWG